MKIPLFFSGKRTSMILAGLAALVLAILWIAGWIAGHEGTLAVLPAAMVLAGCGYIVYLLKSRENYHLLFKHSISAVAVHEIILDKNGRIEDAVFLSVNPAFEKHTGLRAESIMHRRASEVVPGILETPLPEIYGKVILTGEPVSFDLFLKPLHRHYMINAFKIGKNILAAVFTDITDRKQSEEAFREREERWRSIVKASPDGIVIASMDGTVEEASDVAVSMYDYTTPDEVVGKNMLTFLDETGREIAAGRVADMIGGKYSGPAEYKAIKKDGTRFYVEVNGEVLRDGHGRPTRLLFVERDITDRKRAAEEIRRNQSRLRALTDILQHPSASIQEFLNYALDQAIALTESKIGYIYHYHGDRKEFVLNTWSKEVLPACAVTDPQTCYELDKTGIWGEAVRQRRSIVINDFQAAHPLKKGYPEGHVELYRFMTIPIFQDEDIVGVVGLANKDSDYDETDVLQTRLLIEAVWKETQRIRADEALARSEAFVSMMLETVPIPVFYKDSQGRYLGFNKAYELFFGRPKEELIGKTVFDISSPELAKVYHAADAELFEKPGVQVYDSQVQDARGEMHDVIFHKASFTDTNGKVSGLIGAILDITQRKGAEKALAEKITQLQQALDQIKTLRGIVPICASCKKIRDDKGYWNQVEEYIRDHTEAEFSHGICPECIAKLYPEYFKDQKKRKIPGDGEKDQGEGGSSDSGSEI